MFGNTGTCLCLRSPAGELGQGPSLVRRVHGHTQPAQDLRVSDPHHRPNINMQRISRQLVGQENAPRSHTLKHTQQQEEFALQAKTLILSPLTLSQSGPNNHSSVSA